MSKNIYTVFPGCLLNFETVRCGAYLRGALISELGK